MADTLYTLIETNFGEHTPVGRSGGNTYRPNGTTPRDGGTRDDKEARSPEPTLSPPYVQEGTPRRPGTRRDGNADPDNQAGGPPPRDAGGAAQAGDAVRGVPAGSSTLLI
jgi:hypothetical protein